MLVRFGTLLSVALSALGNLASASDMDAIDREDGIVYLQSIVPGYPERFIVYRDGWEIDFEHYVDYGDGWEMEEHRDYWEWTIDGIEFLGDQDSDELLVGLQGYADESMAIHIPVIAYGLGGEDSLVGGQAMCELYGGSGVDNLMGSFGPDLLDPGSDPDEGTILGLGGADTFVKWQAYLKHPQTGYYSYQDYQEMVTDFAADEGDHWLIRKKAKPNKQSIMNGGKIETGNKPIVPKVDLRLLQE